MLFQYFDVLVNQAVSDGSLVNPSDALLTLQGKAKNILLVERTALNIIGRMSGIATATKNFVESVRSVNPKCRIAATRKTCPGFRKLDKKAVVLGGGDPHRWNLSDGILIKDNHLALVGLEEAIAKAKARSRYHRVEVEVESKEDAIRAARSGADIIMFDNMTPKQVQESINSLKRENLRHKVLIEISGGVNADNIAQYAILGVDIISIGALTHSVKNIPVHLHILSPKNKM